VRAEYDEGMVAMSAGDNDRAVELFYNALEAGALVSRPAARLARAEGLARLHRSEEAEAELRLVALEPVTPADRPAVLVARMTHIQGLIALSRGDLELARTRFEEAVAAWRRISLAFDADEYLGNLVDLGRPTAGTVEPTQELRAWSRSSPTLKGAHMPTFDDATTTTAPVEEVWKLLYDPARLIEWWEGIERIETHGTDGKGNVTIWPDGYPDFPMPQNLRTDADGKRVTVSCLVSDLVFAWKLEPLEDGTRIAVHVEIPEAEAFRLDDQRAAISASLRALAELANDGLPARG
jgi:tetratricopeptide (TPR) repeat protein